MDLTAGLILFIVLIISISILALRFLKGRSKIMEYFQNVRIQILFVILWTTIGFITKLDNNQRCGDIIYSTSILDFENILYSLISIFLLLSSLSRRNVIKVLFIIETIYWLIKLILLKSGYSTGWGPNLEVFSYDYIALLLRIWVISRLFNKLNIKVYILPIFSGILITIKTLFFACPDDFIKREIITPYLSERLISKIEGEWEGIATWKIGLKEKIMFNKSIQEDSTLRTTNGLIDILSNNNQSIEEKKTLDTFFLSLPDYKFYVKQINGHEIYELKSKIHITFRDSTVLINGLDYFINSTYSLKFVDPSFNSTIFFTYLSDEYNTEFEKLDNYLKLRDKYLENRKFIEIVLKMKHLGRKKLIGSLNDIYFIKLKRIK
jgi:hypothetical protein